MSECIYVSDKFNKNIDVLIIDLDEYTAEIEGIYRIETIIKNLKNISTTTKLYSTSTAKLVESMSKLKYSECGSWFICRQLWPANFKKICKYKSIQLVGAYRELCMMEVADMLASIRIKPIIIDNDIYSISAKHSVKDGDTLENRAEELKKQLIRI